MNNFDVSLKSLMNAYYQMHNYNFTRDNSGNRVLVEKQTGELIYDEYIINKYKMLFEWLKAVKSVTEINGITDKTISEDDISLAFSKEGHEIYKIVMESTKQLLMNDNLNYKEFEKMIACSNLDFYGKRIAEKLILDKLSSNSGLSTIVNWVSYAIPESQKNRRTM